MVAQDNCWPVWPLVVVGPGGADDNRIRINWENSQPGVGCRARDRGRGGLVRPLTGTRQVQAARRRGAVGPRAQREAAQRAEAGRLSVRPTFADPVLCRQAGWCPSGAGPAGRLGYGSFRSTCGLTEFHEPRGTCGRARPTAASVRDERILCDERFRRAHRRHTRRCEDGPRDPAEVWRAAVRRRTSTSTAKQRNQLVEWGE